MKASFVLLLFLTLPLLAQESASPQTGPAFNEDAYTNDETGVPSPIADGTVSQSQSKTDEIDYTVLSSVTQRKFVSESPELPGLPKVEGVISITTQLVADPGLTDPLPPLPPLPVDDPAVQARLAVMREEYKETRMLFVSATVIDNSRTLLRCYANGDGKGEVAVISNIDFNDFSGFDTFNVKGINSESGVAEIRRYALIMSIINHDSQKLAKLYARRGQSYQPLPDLRLPSSGNPTFEVTEGSDKDAVQAIADMHTLYQVEGLRMREARLAREKAYEERRAYLLANPPKPQDVTFKFWKRSEPSPASGLENGGGQ